MRTSSAMKPVASRRTGRRPRQGHRAMAALAVALTAVATPVLTTSVLAGGASAQPASSVSRDGAYHVFARSFVENADHTVTLPIYHARSDHQTVSYVVTDASDKRVARRLGVNWAPRLANARGTAAVQKTRVTRSGVLRIPATIDFTPERVVVPGPTGFPPDQADPGAIGQPRYSPLIELADGTVLDAPQVANSTGHADKLVSSDDHQATYRETDGFYDGHAVHYVSFEASIPLAAALENATESPTLDASPPDDPRSTGDVSPAPAREEIGIVTNGQLGADNPERQGLSSALLDGLDPLNILGEVPEHTRASHYSPLWDANLATWTQLAEDQDRVRQVTRFDDLLDLADQGLITAPDGSPFARSNFVINCPAISIQR